MNSLKTWLNGLEQRERIMVVVGAVAVVLAVFYYGIWQPLNSSLALARSQVVVETQQTRWLLGLQQEAQTLRINNRGGPVKGRNQSILAIIDTTSRERGLADAVRRIQPDNNDEAIVTLDDAAFNDLLYWLHMLRQDYSIRVTNLTITRDTKPGLIQARLKLERVGT